MAGFFRSLPFSVVLLFIASAAMLVPTIYGRVNDDTDTARAFLYGAILCGMAGLLIGFATQRRSEDRSERGYLLGLLFAYLWLPIVLAIPMQQAVPATRFINVYFDMISAFTTTGAPIFEPDRLTMTVHLWRATVGWFGGLLIWVSAVAVLAPLNLGGYEVTSEAAVQGRVSSGTVQMRAASPASRLRKHTRRLVPIYVVLTLVLAVALAAAGERPVFAVIYAMSTMATSGITPNNAFAGSLSGVPGEMLIFAFFLFALSRRSFISGFGRELYTRLSRDREIRLALFVGIVVPSLLFLRHWVGALEVDDLGNASAALTALWGSLFTVLSFLTTTGFVSTGWDEAQSWSGLPTPGLLLIGLCMIGGGVATTAGGLKLLRVYALFKHGTREIEKLIHPHSVASAGRLGRRIRREGAYIAWVFLMLLLVSTAAVMLALAATGLDFEEAMILTIAALSTTGPLAQIAGETPISYLTLSDPAKLILAAAMVIGRMEALVFIAVLNPSFWRD